MVVVVVSGPALYDSWHGHHGFFFFEHFRTGVYSIRARVPQQRKTRVCTLKSIAQTENDRSNTDERANSRRRRCLDDDDDDPLILKADRRPVTQFSVRRRARVRTAPRGRQPNTRRACVVSIKCARTLPTSHPHRITRAGHALPTSAPQRVATGRVVFGEGQSPVSKSAPHEHCKLPKE